MQLFVSMRTIAFSFAGGCRLAVFAASTPRAEDWGEFLHFLQSNTSTRQRSVVLSEGKLSNQQRRELQAALGPHDGTDRRVAIVAKSTVVRGFVKGISLFDPTFQGFSPWEIDAALRYADVPHSAFASVKRVLRDLRAELDLEPWPELD